MYRNILQCTPNGPYSKRNGAKSKNYKLIIFNKHNHIQRTRSHSTHPNTCTFNKHDHIQQTQKHSTIHYKFSHLISTITFNTFEHTHTQQRRNQSHPAGSDHIQQSRSRHFLVVNKSQKPVCLYSEC